MKQILVLIGVLWFLTSPPKLIAQTRNSSYSDSIKEFFRDWSDSHREFDHPLILDTATLFYNWVDSFTLRDESKFRFNLNSTKAYKYKYPIDDEVKARLDSIAFSKRELDFAIRKMQRPEVARWDTSFFSQSHLVTKKKASSFFRLYFAVQNQASDVMRKCGFDTVKMKNYSIYRQYRQMQNDTLWHQGYWKFSNPVFLKNGTVALLFYWHFSGNAYIHHRFDVYKKESGHWNYFGFLSGGEIN